MFGHESKLKVKEVLVYYAEQEIAIERLRQILAAMRDFEPYTAFKRIDRQNTGYIDADSLTQFQRENGYRELEPSDFKQFIKYFDLDGDQLLNYHDFLQILLPCDDAYLRAAVSQRPNNELPPDELLPMRVERALSQLIFKEVRLHLKADLMKRALENSYDYSVQKAFRAIDDWTYNYIDSSNLKRFLRSMGHISTKQELIAILRRFDMDGDAKINFSEFSLGMKSSLSVFAKKGTKRPKSSNTGYSSKLVKTTSAGKSGAGNFPIRQNATPRRQTATPRTRPGTAGQKRRSSQVRSQRPRTGKMNQRSSKPSLTSYSGAHMPRESSRGRMPSYHQHQSYCDQTERSVQSPSNLNKSVSFSQNVKVREFPSNSQRRVKSKVGKSEQQKNGNGARMPQRRLSYEQQSPQRVERGYSSGGASSARAPHQEPNQYNLSGGSPLVSKRHGSTSNLHDASPVRSNIDCLSHHSSQLGGRSFNYASQAQHHEPAMSPVGAGGYSSSKPQIGHSFHGDPRMPRVDRYELEEYVKALKEIIFSEREVESAKIELALKSDFNIVDAFKMMDVHGSGTLTQADLKEGLERNLGFLDFTADDIYMLFRRFDKDNDGELSYNDFNKVVLPFSREYACLITDRADYYSRRSTNGAHFFNQDTRYEIQAFWGVLFRAERAMESLRCRLNQRPCLNWRELFEFSARSRTGLIISTDVREVLAEQGFYATERELQGLMFRLDRDMDSCISYQDFMDEFAPKLH